MAETPPNAKAANAANAKSATAKPAKAAKALKPPKPAKVKVAAKDKPKPKTKLKSGLERPPKIKVQYGALPWRSSDGGELEILLISSRETRRWVIPKGWPIRGLAPNMAAMREAYEEAGIEGYPSMTPVGSYGYAKRMRTGRERDVKVDVFALQVSVEHPDWPEMHEREKLWVPRSQAATMVDEPELRAMIASFEPR